jgi:hypothetical protein
MGIEQPSFVPQFVQLYLSNVITVLAGNSVNPILFDNVDEDTGGFYNPATGLIVTPTPSIWLIAVDIQLSSLAAPDSGTLDCGIQTIDGTNSGRFAWGACFETRNAPNPFSVGEIALSIPATLVKLVGPADGISVSFDNQLFAQAIDISGGFTGARLTGVKVG